MGESAAHNFALYYMLWKRHADELPRQCVISRLGSASRFAVIGSVLLAVGLVWRPGAGIAAGADPSLGTVKNGGVPNSKEGRSGVYRQLGVGWAVPYSEFKTDPTVLNGSKRQSPTVACGTI